MVDGFGVLDSCCGILIQRELTNNCNSGCTNSSTHRLRRTVDRQWSTVKQQW